MRKTIGYPITWILYYLGDAISRIPNFYYPIYNNLMIWSSKTQKWSRLKSPWIKVKNARTIEE